MPIPQKQQHQLLQHQQSNQNHKQKHKQKQLMNQKIVTLIIHDVYQ